MQDARRLVTDHLNIVLLVLVALGLAFWYQHAALYWEDDSYIHLEYARSVYEGKGFVFNGVLSNGDTAPLWVMMLVGARYLIPDWLMAGKVLASLGTAFSLVVLYVYTRHIQKELGLKNVTLASWLLLLLVINPYFVYWSFSGMEAIAAGGLLMLICLLVTSRAPTKLSFLATAALMGISPLIRPEMILLVGICGPFLLWQWWTLTQSRSMGARFTWFALAAALLVIPAACWAVYALDAFGYVLPNTNAAKRAPPDVSAALRLLQVYAMGFPGLLLSILIVPSIFWLKYRKQKTKTLLREIPMVTWPLLTYVAVTSIFYIVNHTYVQTRYVIVVAPALSAIFYVFLLKLSGVATKNFVFGTATVAALAVTLTQAYPLVRNKGRTGQEIAEMSAYINQNLPADAKIAVYAIGQFGYLVRNQLIDTGGITQPEAAKYLWGPPEKMLEWAKSQGATHYLDGKKPETNAVLVHEVEASAIGWSMQPGYYEQTGRLRLWKLSPP